MGETGHCCTKCGECVRRSADKCSQCDNKGKGWKREVERHPWNAFVDIIKKRGMLEKARVPGGRYTVMVYFPSGDPRSSQEETMLDLFRRDIVEKLAWRTCRNCGGQGK